MDDDEIAGIVKEAVGDALKARLPTKDRLLIEYKEKMATISTIQGLRNLQAEYEGREGITFNDLDISPGKHPEGKPRHISDWAPPVR